jgi:hypothetical protein
VFNGELNVSIKLPVVNVKGLVPEGFIRVTIGVIEYTFPPLESVSSI